MNSSISKNPLGASGLKVLPVGLGLMSLSGVYGQSSDANGISVIHRAIELGVNFLDSADMYGWGHNETLLGQALKGKRDGIVLATKFGQVKSDTGANIVNGRPEYVRAACEASLKRLGLEVIDLYYTHRIDPQVAIEETVGAMADLVKAGKVRALGLCGLLAFGPKHFDGSSSQCRRSHERQTQRSPPLSRRKFCTQPAVAHANGSDSQVEKLHARSTGLGLVVGPRPRHHCHSGHQTSSAC